MAATTGSETAVTVREVIARFPQTMEVFRGFGVDTCCGSGVPIAAAAERDGADLAALLAALADVTGEPV